MNKVGYDVAAIGNHEFDYGIETLMKLSESTEFPYISANFISLEDNKSVFEEYHMEKAGDIDIAFVGVTTPNTFTSSAPEYFKNDEGKFVYDFCGGDELFGVVQKSVDAAIEAGAEYVIAVTHMGVDDADRPYTSKELIANTVGIDAVIDAHSHTVIENELCKNKVGKDVPISSSGSKFEHIGMVRILSDGTVSTKLIDESYKENGLSEEAMACFAENNAFIESIKAEYEKELEKIVCVTECNLTVNDPTKYSEETGEYRLVRRGETNMGDFCADAYRAVLNCDIAVINGGGVRADIKKGEVSFGDILNVNPFGNELCVIEVTGLQILDALEHGARSYPLEEGGFLQVSGLEYEIDEKTASPVVLDEKGMFKEISGERRVKNVTVAGEALKEDAKYTVGGSAYTLLNSGDGFSMFSGATVINNSACTDIDALIKYVEEHLDGVIGKEYENPYGDGRIRIVSKKSEFDDIKGHAAESDIEKGFEMGLVNGVEENLFAPDDSVTRGMFITVLHRLEGMPKADEAAGYADVKDGAYYAEAANWAKENDIVLDCEEGVFGADKVMTREEIATSILNYCRYKGKAPNGAWAIRLDYIDLSEISEEAIEPVMFAKINNIMTGNENREFEPEKAVTRAEAVVIVLKTDEVIKK